MCSEKERNDTWPRQTKKRTEKKIHQLLLHVTFSLCFEEEVQPAELKWTEKCDVLSNRPPPPGKESRRSEMTRSGSEVLLSLSLRVGLLNDTLDITIEKRNLQIVLTTLSRLIDGEDPFVSFSFSFSFLKKKEEERETMPASLRVRMRERERERDGMTSVVQR